MLCTVPVLGPINAALKSYGNHLGWEFRFTPAKSGRNDLFPGILVSLQSLFQPFLHALALFREIPDYSGKIPANSAAAKNIVTVVTV
jgi:hypothetical protein